MGKIKSATIYESPNKVKDILLSKLRDFRSVGNLDGGGNIYVVDWVKEEPAYEGDASRVTVMGEINLAEARRLVTFGLRGDSSTSVTADYLPDEPALEAYVIMILQELEPNQIDASAPKPTQTAEGRQVPKQEPPALPTLTDIITAHRWNRIYDLSKKGELVTAIANDSKVNLGVRQVGRIRRKLNISEPRKKPKAT